VYYRKGMRLFQKILLGLLGAVVILYFGVGPLIYQKCDTALQVKVYAIFSGPTELIIIGFLVVFNLTVYLWNRKHRTEAAALFVFCILIVLLGYFGTGRVIEGGRDVRRIIELRQLQHALEVYQNREGIYPERLENIIEKNIGFNILPTDPTTGKMYEYGLSDDKQSYVLGALLEEWSDDCAGKTKSIGSSLFPASVHGDVYGLSCGGPLYCLKF